MDGVSAQGTTQGLIAFTLQYCTVYSIGVFQKLEVGHMQAHAAKVLRGMPTFSAIACKHSSGVQWRAGFREGRAAGARNLTQIRLSEAQQCPGGHTEPGALCSEHRHDKNKSPHPRQGRRAYLIAICLGMLAAGRAGVSQNARRQYFVKTPQVSSDDAIESSAWAWVDVSEAVGKKQGKEATGSWKSSCTFQDREK